MFKDHVNDPNWLCLHFTSLDNPHISEEGLREVSGDLSQLAYRQEILAEDIDEVPGALWTLKQIDDARVVEIPKTALPLVRVVVGLDPSGSSTNEAGIVGAALGSDGEGYVLADRSVLASSPKKWGQAAVWLYYDLKADRIVGERNYGGDMVKEVIGIVDENASYKDVEATRGKIVRAEPIHALYEKGKIHHVGNKEEFAQMEEEMISYVPEVTKRSPNRMDALVWALTELFPERVRLTLVDQILKEQNEREQAVEKVTISRMTKPVTTDNQAKCEKCGSTLLVKRGPITLCNVCGHTVGPSAIPAIGGRAALQK
jgi:hypothetical protein